MIVILSLKVHLSTYGFFKYPVAASCAFITFNSRVKFLNLNIFKFLSFRLISSWFLCCICMFYSNQQAFLLENVPCNNASCKSVRRMFKVFWELSDLNQIKDAVVATFFDIYEDVSELLQSKRALGVAVPVPGPCTNLAFAAMDCHAWIALDGPLHSKLISIIFLTFERY